MSLATCHLRNSFEDKASNTSASGYGILFHSQFWSQILLTKSRLGRFLFPLGGSCVCRRSTIAPMLGSSYFIVLVAANPDLLISLLPVESCPFLECIGLSAQPLNSAAGL